MNLFNHKLKRNCTHKINKNYNSIKTCLLSFIILGLTFTSCSTEDGTLRAENQLEDIIQVQSSSEIDQVDNVLGDLIIETYEVEESSSLDRNFQVRDIPECVTISIIAQQGYREVTINFGSDGCLVRGHLLKGKIEFDYTRDPEAQQIVINYKLVDFYFDAKSIIGSRYILKELANENGNPQFKHDLSLTVIWPNGMQASREGYRIREWVEGFGNDTYTDNVFEITGHWTATFIRGHKHTYQVLLPLRKEVNCDNFVSGTFNVQRTNFGGLFDFGDGECDNLATFIFNNGEEIEIALN